MYEIKKTKCGVIVVKDNNGHVGMSEAVHAINFYSHAIYRWPELEMLLFHVTNEGKRSYKKGQELKEAGLIKGVSDYICLKPSKIYPYAAIEMKKVKNASATREQKDFLLKCQSEGGLACIVHGYEAALYVLEKYMNDEKI